LHNLILEFAFYSPTIIGSIDLEEVFEVTGERTMLKLKVEEIEEGVVLHCNGALVRGEETNLLCTAVGHYGQTVVLDLSQVSSMDAAGIGALIALQTAGVYLRLENPTKSVREILRVTGMDSVFEIREFPGEAAPFVEGIFANATAALACCPK
jgi:anti-anti-sigma factor